MKKTKAAYLFATQTLGKQALYMWTLTFKEVLDIKDTRKRWNHLLTLVKRRWPELCGLRVFELHKMHGLHVHLVTNRFIDVNVMRALASKAGWGRIHVEQIPAEKADYLAKYLSKERPECLKGWRLWAGFGNWEWTKVKDVGFDSLFSCIYRACKEWLHWTGNKDFYARTRFVAFMELQTIMNDWEAGLGPEGKPYWMCCNEELREAEICPTISFGNRARCPVERSYAALLPECCLRTERNHRLYVFYLTLRVFYGRSKEVLSGSPFTVPLK